MPRTLAIAVLAVILAVILAAIAAAGVLAQDAESYPGESYCRDVPAWPNGTYLGQMHPYHSTFYTNYAEKRDWDPCATWAADQQRSAVRGLSQLGYTVIKPGQAVAVTVPAPEPAANGEVPEENYPGENYCRDAPAWPNGTYLGQMHPYHSTFYTNYAEKRDWDPCATWAADQQRSAIRGLRELGYTVLKPGEAIAAPAPTPAPTPEPTPAPTPAPTPTLPPGGGEPARYQEITGYNGGYGFLELPVGEHQVEFHFDGWSHGPVTLFYITPTGETVMLIDNARTGYSGTFTITAYVAGKYEFQVRATGSWGGTVGAAPVAGSGGGGGGGGGRGSGPAPPFRCNFGGWSSAGNIWQLTDPTDCTYPDGRTVQVIAEVKKSDVFSNGYLAKVIRWTGSRGGTIGKFFFSGSIP